MDKHRSYKRKQQCYLTPNFHSAGVSGSLNRRKMLNNLVL